MENLKTKIVKIVISIIISLLPIIAYFSLLTGISFNISFLRFEQTNTAHVYYSIGFYIVTFLISYLIDPKNNYIPVEYRPDLDQNELLLNRDIILKFIAAMNLFSLMYDTLMSFIYEEPVRLSESLFLEIIKIIISIDSVLIGLLGLGTFYRKNTSTEKTAMLFTFMFLLFSVLTGVNRLILIPKMNNITSESIMMPLEFFSVGASLFMTSLLIFSSKNNDSVEKDTSDS